MSMLLMVCAVICTIAISMIAVAAVRALRRFEDASTELSKTAEAVRVSVGEVRAVSKQIEQIASSVQIPLQRAATEVGDVGHRAARLSHTMLNEVEGPIQNTVALLVGLRTGTRSLLTALSRRASRAHLNGGHDHE